MGANSRIEWTHDSFNPWVGCSKISEGCRFCYAEREMDKRRHFAQWGDNGTRVRTSEANWRKPLAWNAQAIKAGIRRRVFCASLADVFEGRPELAEMVLDLWKLIARTPALDWLILTKRPQNIPANLPNTWGNGWPNVWLGTSIENQEAADLRIPELLKAPAAVHFLSAEPLLGAVDLKLYRSRCPQCGGAELETTCDFCDAEYNTKVATRRIRWVIAGGESGPNARPAHPDWFRSLRDQCTDAEIPFFFKQWGEHGPVMAAPYPVTHVGGDAVVGLGRIGKDAAGRHLDGRTHDAYPEVDTAF